jgi:type IV pilus assembly protein PilC
MNFIEKIKAKLFPTSSISISLKDKINLLEQLSSLLHSWIPITNSVKIMIFQTRNKKMKDMLEMVLENLNKWENLEHIFKLFPKIFSVFDVSIIRMWEVTGKIADAIDTIKIKEEKTRELKGKIMWALVYPMVIIALSLGMIGVFMVYVIPKIQKMYKDSKVNLPELTTTVIQISEFMQNNITEIIIWIIIFLVLFSTFKKHPRTKIHYDHMVLKVPLFWSLIQKKILAMFTETLWTLLHNWVIINQSLEITSHALENDYYEKDMVVLTREVSKWVELSRLMWIMDIHKWKQHPLYPIELASIVKIWEQTGKMSELLLKLSKKYNKEIDEVVKNIGTAIEPIVIIWVGLIVGTLIMAIMLPFFNMVNVL